VIKVPVEVKKRMNSKLIAAFVIAGVSAIVVVGLVAAQVATASAPNGTAAWTSNGGFFGWMGRCFGFRHASYYGTQSPAYPGQPDYITVTNSKTGTTTTYQGYYGYGPCGMMGFRP